MTSERPHSPLAFPGYRRLYIARAVSSAGSYMQIVAATWYAYELTGSAESVGVLSALAFGPSVVGGPLGGALVDRLDPRRLALVLCVLQAVPAAVMAMLSLTGGLSLGWLYALVFVGALPFSLNQPVISLIGPFTVPPQHRQSALALSSMMFNLTRLGGAVAGGFMVQLLGVGSAFAFNAMSYLLVVVALLGTTLEPDIAHLPRQGFSGGMRHGIRDARRMMKDSGVQRLARLAAVCVGVFFTFIAPVEQLMPAVVQQRGKNASAVGLLIGAIGVGAILANPLVARARNSHVQRRRVMAAGLCVAGVGMTALAVAPHRGLAVELLGAVLIGFGWEFVFIGGQSTVAIEVPEMIRGRMMGVFFVLVTATTAVGAVALGELINTVGVRATFLGTAVVVVLAGVVLLMLGERPATSR